MVPVNSFALTGGPASPETQGFQQVGSSDMVDLFTGDFSYNIPLMDIGGYPINLSYSSRVTSGVDFRAKNYDSLDNLEKNSLDFYASVKSLYLQDRQQKILNTNKIIDTQDDSDWEEIDN